MRHQNVNLVSVLAMFQTFRITAVCTGTGERCYEMSRARLLWSDLCDDYRLWGKDGQGPRRMDTLRSDGVNAVVDPRTGHAMHRL